MASAGCPSCGATVMSHNVSDLADEGCLDAQSDGLMLPRSLAQATGDHPEGLCRDLDDVVTYSSSGFHSSG